MFHDNDVYVLLNSCKNSMWSKMSLLGVFSSRSELTRPPAEILSTQGPRKSLIRKAIKYRLQVNTTNNIYLIVVSSTSFKTLGMFQMAVSVSRKKKCKAQFLTLDVESISLLGKELLEKLKVLRIGLPQVVSVRGRQIPELKDPKLFFCHEFGKT